MQRDPNENNNNVSFINNKYILLCLYSRKFHTKTESTDACKLKRACDWFYGHELEHRQDCLINDASLPMEDPGSESKQLTLKWK